MTFGPASFLGVERFHIPIGAQEHFTGDEKTLIRRSSSENYRQVSCNAYVMEEERQVVAESQFKLRSKSAFVNSSGKLAKSRTYQSAFSYL